MELSGLLELLEHRFTTAQWSVEIVNAVTGSPYGSPYGSTGLATEKQTLGNQLPCISPETLPVASSSYES